uniref:exotoxin beta-grasp domain-containing protein n=1 Tax=Staphylococcus pseudintermedius TaxID=283734 RepID=UPI002A247058|nr:exotoxin beta-grasp domain-containing protein [Staphylococcus pseudintermedius]
MGEIQRGLIVFHGSSNPIISYDLFGAKGQYPDTMLRIYQDNKTVDSENVHIDLYLYTN